MRHRTAGFSLVEVMCAILVLGIGLVGLTQGITAALSSSKESELQTTAALFAAGRIEMLRAEGFLSEGTEEGECGEGLSNYRWTQSLTRTSIDGLYEVTVTVEHSKSGKAIYELETMLFEPSGYSTSRTSEKNRDSSSAKKKAGRRP